MFVKNFVELDPPVKQETEHIHKEEAIILNKMHLNYIKSEVYLFK